MATELVSFRLVIVVEYGSTLPGMGVGVGVAAAGGCKMLPMSDDVTLQV